MDGTDHHQEKVEDAVLAVEGEVSLAMAVPVVVVEIDTIVIVAEDGSEAVVVTTGAPTTIVAEGTIVGMETGVEEVDMDEAVVIGDVREVPSLRLVGHQ